jgi:N-acetyl-alpha-D-glucosaminyl L-malate synthase BshA
VGKDKTYEPVVTFSINESDAITAVSQNLKEETYKSFHVKKDIAVIHNFVDVSRFSKKPIDAFRKAVAPNGERILIHASNFRKLKRVDDVIKIFAKVLKEVPSKLMMVGDGPERHMAEELSRELEICDHVRFLGKQEQMEDIMVISDLFLLTSEYESFGLSALEAMAASVPVLSSNAGGLPEINVHGVTGYMAPVGHIDEMAEYAISMLKDDATLTQFKKQAYEHACKFDIKEIVPKYEELYESVLEATAVR